MGTENNTKVKPEDGRAKIPVQRLVMQKFCLRAVVTYSAFTTVDAETYEEAEAIAEQRGVVAFAGEMDMLEESQWVVNTSADFDVDDIVEDA